MAWYKTVHDVERGSNLDLILRGFNGAFNRFTDVLGGGLRAIALALSTPQDNSAQVQAEIDKLVAQLNASTADQKEAIDQQTGDYDAR